MCQSGPDRAKGEYPLWRGTVDYPPPQVEHLHHSIGRCRRRHWCVTQANRLVVAVILLPSFFLSLFPQKWPSRWLPPCCRAAALSKRACASINCMASDGGMSAGCRRHLDTQRLARLHFCATGLIEACAAAASGAAAASALCTCQTAIITDLLSTCFAAASMYVVASCHRDRLLLC